MIGPIMRQAASVILPVIACSAIPALANDSTAQLAAGGLVLTRSDAIEMQTEDLYISRSRVRVRYTFFNSSGKDAQVRVAFPMPALGGPSFFDVDVAMPFAHTPNILGFETRVDGIPVEMEVEQKALAGTVDRTAWLHGQNIPLHPIGEATEEALARLSPAIRAEAIRLGLIDENDHPGWTLHTNYHWVQLFPAGDPVKIEHDYIPAAGGTVASDLGSRADPERVATYCIDPPVLARLRAADRQHEIYAENWLDYILVTGGNWKKPIGRFHLIVDKENATDMVSFCGDGVRKTSPNRFEMLKENWRPERDLSLLFLSRRPSK